jgi:hypothetical protein
MAEAEKNGGATAGEAKPQAKADAPTPPAVDDTPARSIDF